MEIMEDGNLMDRVRILLQRDLEYYEAHQAVLQENLCPEVVGGMLDFPHYASFAAVKLALWWEEAWEAAFQRPSGLLALGADDAEDFSDDETGGDGGHGCGGVAATSSPSEFVSQASSCADQILEHLHTLTQEALDHADLTVLTGALGAAALLKNALWCYNEKLKHAGGGSGGGGGGDGDGAAQGLTLQPSYRRFLEMSEALAERLLDLHGRLLALYVLQDADCLHWEDVRPFFEGERGSFVVQMWWLYMQGTREHLWNTVPPQTAQRVLAGMLNESLAVLTSRLSQAAPSHARAPQLLTDAANVLLCCRHLLASVCSEGAELAGLPAAAAGGGAGGGSGGIGAGGGASGGGRVPRDVHAKCAELLAVLLARGSPLHSLYKVFRKGLGGVPVFSPRDHRLPAAWFVLTAPHLFGGDSASPGAAAPVGELADGPAIALELTVLVAQPQASWPLLLRVLMMRGCRVATVILRELSQRLPSPEASPEHRPSKTNPKSSTASTSNAGAGAGAGAGEASEAEGEAAEAERCGGFLCPGGGECALRAAGEGGRAPLSPGAVVEACAHVVMVAGGPRDLAAALLPALEQRAGAGAGWARCLDRSQLWSQRRPPWLRALLRPLQDAVAPAADTLLFAVQAGASADAACALALDCLCHLADCLPAGALRAAALLEDALPADARPAAGSVLLQLLLAALYARLLAAPADRAPAAAALCEALCDVERAGRHADKVRAFLQIVRECVPLANEDYVQVENVPHMNDVLVSTVLFTSHGRRALKVLWRFLQHSHVWLLGQLGALEPGQVAPPEPPPACAAARPRPPPLLHTMFHVGPRPFDQLLAGQWAPDWEALLQTPLGLSPERLWAQLARRDEFRQGERLSQHDAAVVAALRAVFDPRPDSPSACM